MDYIVHLAILVSIYAILALSLNLVAGFTGMISVAHAAFFGMGAYSVAILGTKFGVGFFAAALGGMFLSVLLALLIGAVLGRFREDFFVLGSVGFGVIVWSIFLNWQELTRGPLGIPGIKRPELFNFSLTDNFQFLLLAALTALGVYLICRFLERASFGRVLTAIREDEDAIQIFGYRSFFYKLAVFAIGAALASIAGSLFASYITFIDPSSFTLNESIFILAIIILGGLASNRGAVLGAVALVLLPEILRFAGFPSDIAAQMRQAVYGLLLILLMLYRPQGLAGEYKL